VSREEVKGDAKNGETSRPKEEDAQKKKSGVHPSQAKRTAMQEEETCKKMKYHKKPPVITITEDDVELVADKVQDRGEDVVHTAEGRGRRSWLSWWNSMILYKGCRFLQCNKLHRNNQRRHNNTMHRRNKRKQWR
jgi:hypothetical protein